MFTKGIIIGRRIFKDSRRKHIDSGTIKHLSPKKFREDPPPITIDKSETTKEEDNEFVNGLLKELQEEAISGTEAPVSELVETTKMNSYYIVIDFEATCFKKKQVPREETEIIEFAAVAIDKESLLPVGEFDMFIRPVIHPKLDPFCTELTTIIQEDVDSAYTFPTVLRQFSSWLQQYKGPKTFCSWGDYDRKQLVMECARNKLAYPFDEDHLNVKELFSKSKGYKRKYGVSGALNHLKMKFEGTHHRGIDDARNIVRIMKVILTEPS